MAKTTNTFNSSTAPVGGTIATRALGPNERQPNDTKQGQYQGAKPVRNTKQYPHTTTSPENNDVVCFDDLVRSGPSDRTRPVEFEYVADGQQWKKDTSGTAIAEWQQVNENINAPDAINRTSVGPVMGFHKAPMSYTFSEAENNMISSGGVLDHYSKKPTYSDANRV